MAGDLWLVKCKDAFNHLGRLLLLKRHPMRVHEVHAESFKFVRLILLCRLYLVVAEIAHLAIRSQELCWRQVVRVQHLDLGDAARKHGHLGLEVLVDPLADPVLVHRVLHG